MALREFPKESKVQQDHLDQRDLLGLLGLQVMESKDQQEHLDLLVYLEHLEWESQACQDYRANQEELVMLALKEKLVLRVKMAQLVNQVHQGLQGHLGYQG